jgi:hypothetical protein
MNAVVNTIQPFVESNTSVKFPTFYFIPMEATAAVLLNKLDLRSLTDKTKMREVFGDEDLARYMAMVNLLRITHRNCNPNVNMNMETPFNWDLTCHLYDSPFYEASLKEYEAYVNKKTSDLTKTSLNENTVSPSQVAKPVSKQMYKISPLGTDSCYLVEIHEDFIIALKDRDIEFKFISDCLKVLCVELSYEAIATHYLMFQSYLRSMPCTESV